MAGPRKLHLAVSENRMLRVIPPAVLDEAVDRRELREDEYPVTIQLTPDQVHQIDRAETILNDIIAYRRGELDVLQMIMVLIRDRPTENTPHDVYTITDDPSNMTGLLLQFYDGSRFSITVSERRSVACIPLPNSSQEDNNAM